MGEAKMSVAVSNVGGIDQTELSFGPGVTVLAGRNATNRTSFLQAVMAAFGSEHASLKGDADEGRVELTLDGETYTRTLTRSNGGVTYGGDPYLDDAALADLFAFLIETNEARLAVPRGDDLRDLIMRPVDTAAIKAEIRSLESEKREIDDELEALSSLADRVPRLQERLTQRRSDLEETEAELAERREVLDELDRDLAETREQQSEVEETFSELREARQELEDLEYRLETEQESLASLEEEQAELEAAWEDLETVSEARLDELDVELQRLRDDKQALETEISTLQRVIQFNEEMLDGASADIATALRPDGGATDAAVTDELLAESEVICWTCGSPVERSSVEETLDRLRSLLSDKHAAIRDLEDEIDDVKGEKRGIESQQDRVAEVSRRRSTVEADIERRKDAIDDLQERIEAQSSEIESLEAAAEARDDDEYGEVLEAHKAVTELELERDRLAAEIEDVEDELADVEDRLESRDRIEAQREDVVDDLRDCRTRIERLERESIEAFNEHMAEILDILGYENIDRVWLERTERQVREGRRSVTRSHFDLHIVRSTADGTTYEDTVDHLSESEREVTSLVFALAGYLAHDVYETLPVMLLDSLEAIDSDRIAALVEYFEGYADYLVVALLPEDAQAIGDAHQTISEI